MNLKYLVLWLFWAILGKRLQFENPEVGLRQGLRAIRLSILRKVKPCLPLTVLIMKAELVKAANEVIPNQQILVNMVSRRVRQLCLGHRPLVEFAPGLGHADIALTEIAGGKIAFESTAAENGTSPSADVVQFPGVIVSKKAPKKKAA